MGLPDELMHQMATCHTAANEFLRQFWASVFSNQQEYRSLSVTKLNEQREQREAKAAKMVSYLQSTQEKVNALLPLARQLSIDPNVVETVSETTRTWCR